MLRAAKSKQKKTLDMFPHVINLFSEFVHTPLNSKLYIPEQRLFIIIGAVVVQHSIHSSQHKPALMVKPAGCKVRILCFQHHSKHPAFFCPLDGCIHQFSTDSLSPIFSSNCNILYYSNTCSNCALILSALRIGTPHKP